MIIIKNYKERRCESGAQIFKISLGKHGDTHKIFGRQDWQGFSLPGCGLLCCQAQIVEKGGEIAIPFIDPVPEAGDVAGSEIASNEGGFS